MDEKEDRLRFDMKLTPKVRRIIDNGSERNGIGKAAFVRMVLMNYESGAGESAKISPGPVQKPKSMEDIGHDEE